MSQVMYPPRFKACEKLIEVRRARGISRVKMAELLGLSSSDSVLKIEKGRETVTKAVMARWTRVLGGDLSLWSEVPCFRPTRRNRRQNPRYTPRERLIAARDALCLDRRQLAERLGISRFHLFNVEKGRRDASVAVMIQWTKALKGDLSLWSDADRARLRTCYEDIRSLGQLRASIPEAAE